MTINAAALALVGLLVAGCAGGSAASPSPRNGLEGRSFLSTAIEGRALVAGSRVRITFQDGRIGLSAGCNQMGGTYGLDGDRLGVRDLATTDMGCEAPLMDQDAWLSGFVNGATFDLAGDSLRLAKGGITLTLLDREVADPDRPLLGTRWIVDGIVTGQAVSSVPAGIEAALTFHGDRVDLEAGCNTGGGPVAFGSGTMTFGPIALTKMACEPERMALEQAVSAALTGTRTYVIEAGTMTLTNGQGGLLLRAAPAAP